MLSSIQNGRFWFAEKSYFSSILNRPCAGSLLYAETETKRQEEK